MTNMDSTLASLRKQDWAFSDADSNYPPHDLHPYPARFIPQIPKTLIEALSSPGETIIDPFCGGGTTLVEASLLGRDSIGTDINPLAILISRAKTTPLSGIQIQAISELSQQAMHLSFIREGRAPLFASVTTEPSGKIPNIPNLPRWFQPQVISELSALNVLLDGLPDEPSRTFCQVALSSILVRVSNQDSETRYTARDKAIAKGSVFALFSHSLNSMLRSIQQYQLVRQPVRVQAEIMDARKLDVIPDRSCHLVVTSPPYPNAFDYHLYHRHRLFWLGFDPISVGHNEIGSHLNYQKNNESIDKFKADMKLCLTHIWRILAPSRYFCVVIGDSVFNRRLIDNGYLLQNLAEQVGFSTRISTKRPVHATRRSFAFPARRLKEEHLLVMERQ